MFKPNSLTLTPAYGRDYKSKAAVLKDWDDNKDFKIASTGQYVNKAQCHELIANGINSLSFRYSNMTRVTILDILSQPK